MQINLPIDVAPRVARLVSMVPYVIVVVYYLVSTEPISTMTAFKACMPERPLENGDVQLAVKTEQM